MNRVFHKIIKRTAGLENVVRLYSASSLVPQVTMLIEDEMIFQDQVQILKVFNMIKTELYCRPISVSRNGGNDD